MSGWTMDGMCAEIMRNEGGFVDDPQDSGGATNYGISLRFAVSYPAVFDLDGDGQVTIADIHAMTPAVAKVAYVQFFFFPAGLQQLPNISNILMQLFDLAVNSGVNRGAHKSECAMVLQHSLQVPADGVIGPATVAALNAKLASKGEVQTNNDIVTARCTFYDQVVSAHPEDQKFLDGWKRRARKYIA